MRDFLQMEKVRNQLCSNSFYSGHANRFVPVTVAVRSEAWFLTGWLLGSWVRIPLKAWMFVRVFLCCVVLCR
jgi:hypothetical protein